MNFDNSLSIGSLLQGGRYRILKVLGKGGFGITYLSEQVGLHRKVAIKEFFMSDYCNRGYDSSHVEVPSVGSRELVTKYKSKFLKEAQMIAKLSHDHIIKIHDVFEENGTAYYVMEYHSGHSLKDLVCECGKLSEPQSLNYIRQVSSALCYLHERKINHLDIKPGNILLSDKGRVVLIDFGVSKHYDVSGSQTTTTPLAVSDGYSPLEQYKKGGVREFSPSTDIYSLGATLFKLLTGNRPPEASDIFTNGFPYDEFHHLGISSKTLACLVKSMQPNKHERYQSVSDFTTALSDDTEETEFVVEISDETASETSSSFSHSQGNLSANQSQSTRSASRFWPNGQQWLSLSVVVALLFAIVVIVDVFQTKYERIAREEEERLELLELERAEKERIAREEEERLERERAEKERRETINGFQVTWSSDVSSEQKQILRCLIENMVSVHGGSFDMGSTDSDANEHERPIHRVTLSDYCIGKYEVTQEEWKAVMGSNPSESKGDNLPVEQVSWNDCQVFISKLNALTGLCFRLPTEAEWEYAARGGNRSEGYKYSGSNHIGDVAWYDANSGDDTYYHIGHTHPIGKKLPNELGLYDMSGNVYEWCSDWYNKNYYSSSSSSNPTGPDSGSLRVLRGGCLITPARSCRVSYRYHDPPESVYYLFGFRLAF